MPNAPPERTRHRLHVPTIVYVVGFIVIAMFAARLVDHVGQVAERTVSYNEFLASIDRGQLSNVDIAEHELVGHLKKPAGGFDRIVTSRLPSINESDLIAHLEQHNVAFSGRISTGQGWGDILAMWLPLVLLAAIWIVGFRHLRKTPAMSFGRTRAKLYDRSKEEHVTFQDVAGVDEAKEELVEVIDFLRDPTKYGRLGGRMPKGVLLVGPPGTGKTLLAKAVAGESGVPFFSMSGAEFVEMFVGVGAARVRDLFAQAKENAPCIVFIDELDAVGRARIAGRGAILSNDEREQTLNQLLAEMDGFDSSKGVIIMAATNAPEVLDPALLRAGRFDRQIVVDRPDLAGREAILHVHARQLKLAGDVQMKVIAARTPGMVGADLANIVNEAALLAARRGADQIEMRDLEEAIDRVTLGLERRSHVMTPAEKKRVAYHETGHALVALSVPHADPVHRISIVPRSIGALGHTLQLPTQERFLMTRPEIEDHIAVLLGGRVAEQLAFGGVVSTGAVDDLEKATALVRLMVTRFGMSDALGLLTWENPMAPRFLESALFPSARDYSETTGEKIDAEAMAIIEAARTRVESILGARRHDLDVVAKTLMEQETLSREDLDRLLEQPPALAAV
ncbi:MAG TPA: ATP-dependent zinc metalloprotease FtsH [Thermoanaerobaculia bacterium]|nr:ATP-dependent zinc metalloprotease FtsH [Thermoanaerobaculia bacterium]